MNAISKIFQTLTNPKRTRFLLNLPFTGYLFDIGWFGAYNAKKPIDKLNEPIPWLTYSLIEFLEPRLQKEFTILEFGSGNSTLFFSKRVKHIVSIEHDQKWIETLKQETPNNCQIINYDLSDEKYEKPIINNCEFDIILVDGRKRVKCVLNNIEKLSKSGVIILDDSERDEYREALNFMIECNFKRIDFWGISPGTFYRKCTSIFYRQGNCINI